MLTRLSTTQNTAVLDSKFYSQAASIGGAAAIIHAATASPTLSLLDLTQAPNVAYQSVSSVYTAYSNTGGAAPTAAAGAAAGTSPTGPTNVGNGNTFTVSLTTGTATTTGTLFTETWPATVSFGRVPNVTVVSTGSQCSGLYLYRHRLDYPCADGDHGELHRPQQPLTPSRSRHSKWRSS